MMHLAFEHLVIFPSEDIYVLLSEQARIESCMSFVEYGLILGIGFDLDLNIERRSAAVSVA